MYTGKRVLVNLEVDPDLPPYWAYVSPKFLPTHPTPREVLEQKYAVVYTREEKKERKEPLAFANPSSHGYGGGETPWPFDVERALRDGRYRAGIRNAIKSNWTAQNWKFEARRLLIRVLDAL